jgi:hypothetical protein
MLYVLMYRLAWPLGPRCQDLERVQVMAKSAQKSIVALVPSKGRKVADTTATMAAANVQKEVKRPSDLDIVDGNTAKATFTVSNPKVGPHIVEHSCTLDFSNVTERKDWIRIACTNGVIVKLQSRMRKHLDNMGKLHNTDQFTTIDVAELMTERASGGSLRQRDPVVEAYKRIAAIENAGVELSKADKAKIVRQAEKDKAALASAQPAAPQPVNEPKAAKRR